MYFLHSYFIQNCRIFFTVFYGPYGVDIMFNKRYLDGVTNAISTVVKNYPRVKKGKLPPVSIFASYKVQISLFRCENRPGRAISETASENLFFIFFS